ncbi:unnamed protein product [Arctogadus glacialis]
MNTGPGEPTSDISTSRDNKGQETTQQQHSAELSGPTDEGNRRVVLRIGSLCPDDAHHSSISVEPVSLLKGQLESTF